MTIEYGSIKKYIRRQTPEEGFGFFGRTFSNLKREVFFNSKKISRKHPEIAEKLENGEDFKAFSFWYKIEIGEKGERVSELWLNANNIPKSYTNELCTLTERVESIWRDVSSPRPSWLERVTIDLVGVDRRDELNNERDDLEIQRKLIEEKRCRDADAECLKQIKARQEKERQETELRIKLEAERQEQIRVSQEEVRKKAEQQSQQRKNEIRKICEEIGIKSLVHFTHIQNLKSILQYGLIGRSQLREMCLEFQYNDEVRLEGQRAATCLSISFPNYKMFYKYRCADSIDSNWVVLLLKPSILWELNCKFYIENAASNNARNSNLRGDRAQPSNLREMFEDYGAIRRASLQIPNHFTTHPQAEVLVFDQIHPCFIEKVNFNSLQDAIEWIKLNPGNYSQTFLPMPRYTWNHSSYFKPRDDWKMWQNNF
jgi:hypothetical protein